MHILKIHSIILRISLNVSSSLVVVRLFFRRASRHVIAWFYFLKIKIIENKTLKLY